MTGKDTEDERAAQEPCDDVAESGELIALCEQRGQMYALLSRLYRREVGEEYLQELKASRFPAKTGNASADEGYRLIARFLSNVHPGSADDLALDFAHTFIGEGMSTFSAAYPYESVHTSEKRMLMQDARDEVLAIMRSEGVGKRDDYRETEDHIAAELEFMQILAERTVEALRDSDDENAVRLLETQRNFLLDHLVSWVPLLTKDMRSFAQTDLYQGLASLTDGFLETDQEFLEEVCGTQA